MKKKQRSAERGNASAPTTTTAAADLKSLIHDSSLFFDKLVELIPARFYLSTDDANDSKPWFQGLSKAAKASAKQQTKENIKKSRRDRLDPDRSQTTTLDLLKRSIETSNKSNNADTDSEDEHEDEGPDDAVKPVVKFDDETRSVTYEELRQKLHRRIEELRSSRGDGENSTSHRREKREIRQIQRKRDRDSRGSKDGTFAKPEVDIEKEVAEATKGIEFGKVRIGGEEEVGRKTKRRKVSREKELEMAKKLQESKKEDAEVARKHSWKAATSRAAGAKVHDDPKLLKQSIQKEKKRHGKSTEKWKDRVESREKMKAEKQQKRAGNIAGRIHEKKMRKIAKREKKLMRPGFEGRKEGYINAD